MIERLIDLDTRLMLALNGSDSLYMDGVMRLFSSTWTWIPLACVLLIILFKNNRIASFIAALLMIALTVYVCDRVSSGYIKPMIGRLRPSNEPMILDQIDIVNGSRYGSYGFISSHAANCFGLFMFLSLLIRQRAFNLTLFAWAAIDSFSRVYLGVHYPGDILCGAIFGMVVGAFVYLIYYILTRRFQSGPGKITNFYTSTGYLMEDVQLVLVVFYLTYAFIALYSFVYINNKFL